MLKCFFTYISDNNDNLYTFENEFKTPLKDLRKSKKVKYLKDNEGYQIIEHLEYMCLNRGSYYDYIYALGIKCMLYGGLRISEVLTLKLHDFTVSELTNDEGEYDIYEILLKETKSGEEQTALIKIADIHEELTYFREFRNEHDHIFKSKTKRSLMHRSNFYTSVKTIMSKAGVDKKGLHIYRHTCAMQLYRNLKTSL